MTWREAFRQSPLARQLIIWTVLFSSAVTLVLTGLQLYTDYRRDVSQIEHNFDEIESVHLATLTQSLWATDQARLQLQLEGMLQLRDMQYFEVREGELVWARAGQAASTNILKREIALYYRYDGRDQHLGTLLAVATLEQVYARLLGKALTILVSNGIKTFLVALFMLVLIYYQMTRHLLAISRFVRQFDLLEPSPPLVLERAPREDELRSTEVALNHLRARLKDSIEKLAASEERFRYAFEQMAVGIAHVAPSGRFLRVNQKLCDIVGYSRGELLAKTFQDITHPDDLDADLAQVRQVLAGEIKTYSMEKRYFRRDGRIVWVNLTVSLVCKADGSPEYFIAVIEDIDARRLAESRSRRSEALLAEAQRIAHLGSFEWDAVSGELHWSEELYRIYGVTPQRFTPTFETFLARLHPDDREHVQAMALSVLKDGEPLKYEERVVRPGGEVRLLATEVSPVKGGDGHVVRLIGACHDITERKHAESALRERDEVLRLFVEHSPAAIAMLDNEMRYVVVSRRWMTDYRLGEADIIGRSHYEVFPEVTQRWRDIHRRCLAGATERCDEDPFVRPDGHTEWVKWEICPWYREEGGVGGIGGIIIFSELVTEYKRAQEIFLKNEKKFRAIIDASPVPYALNDEQQNIVYLNAAFVRAYGYTLEDIPTLADWWPKAYPDPQYRQWVAATWQERLNKVRKKGEVFEPLELNVHCKNGSVRTVLAEAAAIDESWDGPHLVILYDITERKHNESERERIMDELNRRNVEMESFIYTISHDLKSPLITIGGFSSLMEKDIKRNDQASMADSLREIKKAVELMHAHINDLLLLSRTGRVSAERTDVSLRALLEELAGQFDQRITDEHAQLIIAPDLPVIRADRKGIVRVYTNLIDNALKYRRPDTAPMIEVGWLLQGDELQLYVRDNGKGIKQEYQQRIFGLFQRIDSNIEGTGVGLAISKRVIEVHGGRMWVESKPGKGSTFWIALPESIIVEG